MLGFESYMLNEQLLVFIQFRKWINGKFIGVSSYKDSTSFAFSIMWLFGLEEDQSWIRSIWLDFWLIF